MHNNKIKNKLTLPINCCCFFLIDALPFVQINPIFKLIIYYSLIVCKFKFKQPATFFRGVNMFF